MAGRQSFILHTILFLAVAASLMTTVSRDLWNPDEPRYAQVAREMMRSGDYIHPRLNGKSYPDKPPLYFWLIAAASLFSGEVSAFSARLPSVLAGLGVALLTFLLGRRLFNRRTGLMAAIILLTNVEFFYIMTSCHLDTLLAFWVILAVYLFHTGYGSEKQIYCYYGM